MGTGSVLLKMLAVAASASLVLMACNKDGRKGSAGRSDASGRSDTLESASQGTGYGGVGTGTGGAGTGDMPDRTGVVTEHDTDFERSFYGPPGSDWRFTPGTGLYNFPDMGIGGTGPDSQVKAKPAKAPKASKQDKTKSTAAHKDTLTHKDTLKDSVKKSDTGAGSY